MKKGANQEVEGRIEKGGVVAECVYEWEEMSDVVGRNCEGGTEGKEEGVVDGRGINNKEQFQGEEEMVKGEWG